MMSRDWSAKFLAISSILSLYVINTSTRSSAAHWKLVLDEGSGRSLIVPSAEGELHGPTLSPLPVPVEQSPDTRDMNETIDGTSLGIPSWAARESEDLVFQILTTTVLSSRGSWTKNGQETYCVGCPLTGVKPVNDSANQLEDGGEVLDCGKSVNFTYYDQLMGIANRVNHPHIPEPQVALLFRKKNSKKETIDLGTLERKLWKAKKEKPSSVQLYNQIGNFWRIKGHTPRAIECFRRALAVAPNNPEVLHNLARLLLTLQYLDDALFLARRSLELQAQDRSAWQQHFTLGEILKAYGHHQEALLHFKHTLELRPDHTGAQEALRELDTLLAGSGLHVCTLLIIIFLVLGVLLVLLSSFESDESSDMGSRPQPRHFSRALAMRSLKLGISPRALRSKRFP